MTIFIDPGHGGRYPGAVYEKVAEKDINLDIAKKVATRLKAKGHAVIMSRENDATVDVGTRPKLAAQAGAEIFVSIHCNASSVAPVIGGVETFYKRGSKVGEWLARQIQWAVVNGTKQHSRGVKPTDDIHVVVAPQMPACLIECGFMNVKQDRELLAKPDYRDKMANAIAYGISEYIAHPIKEDN